MKLLACGLFSERSFARPFAPLLSVSLLMGTIGCKENIEPAPSPTIATPPVPKPSSAPIPALPPAHAGPQLGVEWEVPKGWEEDKKPRMMRAATYFAPAEKGPAEISVFFFGAGQGGEREANISRWVDQFTGVTKDGIKRSEAEANGLKRFSVSIARGNFSSGMPGQNGVQPDWGMEGAIVETPTGSYYFKMVGPAESVKAQAPAFVQLLESIKLKS